MMDITPFSAVFDVIGKVIDRVFPDPVAAANAKLEMAKMTQTGELQTVLAQLEVAKAEAGNGSMFVAGARPFVMWVCGVGLGIQFIVEPLAQWGMILAGKTVTLPPLDMSVLLTLLFGMLGLGTQRTFEKLKGVQTTSIGKK
jgi:hypothetical protein